MARSRRRDELRDDIRLEARMENSSFVTDAQINHFINQAIAGYHDMISEEDESVFRSSTTGTTDANGLLTLPTDFHRLIGVDVDTTARLKTTARRLDWGDRNRYFSAPGESVVIWYVKEAPELTLDSQEVITMGNWDDWIVLTVAIRLLDMEESDTAPLAMRLAETESRIRRLVGKRDAGEPRTVRNVRSGWRSFFYSIESEFVLSGTDPVLRLYTLDRGVV